MCLIQCAWRVCTGLESMVYPKVERAQDDIFLMAGSSINSPLLVTLFSQISKPTIDIDKILVQLASVAADGPTLNQHWVEILCLQDIPNG